MLADEAVVLLAESSPRDSATDPRQDMLRSAPSCREGRVLGGRVPQDLRVVPERGHSGARVHEVVRKTAFLHPGTPGGSWVRRCLVEGGVCERVDEPDYEAPLHLEVGVQDRQ